VQEQSLFLQEFVGKWTFEHPAHFLRNKVCS
jgi:hypothetical protein